MSTLSDQPWLAAQADGFTPGMRAAEAHDFWNEHQGNATHAAMVVAVRVVEELAGGTEDQPMGVQPPPPPAQLYLPMGGTERGEPVAHATWNVVAALAAESTVGVRDPFLAGQVQDIADHHGGDGVYLFTWWAWSAWRAIRSTRDPNAVEAARQAITSKLAGLS